MIEEKIDNVESISGIKATPWRSIRAVVELHKPVFAIVDGVKGPEYCQRCAEGRGYSSYPCPTIKAIQEQLK